VQLGSLRVLAAAQYVLLLCSSVAGQAVPVGGGHYWGQRIVAEIVEAFEKKSPDIKVSMAPVIDWKPWRLLDDDKGFVLVHYRRLKNIPALAGKTGVEEFVIGRSGVIVIANNANPVKSLTVAQIRLLLSARGRGVTWKKFGGQDEPTVCITERGWSQAWHIIRRTCMLLDDDYGGRLYEFRRDLVTKSEARAIVEQVKKDSDAVGFLLWQAGCEKWLKGVKVLAVGSGQEAMKLRPREGVPKGYALSEEVILLLSPKAAPGARELCAFAVGTDGAAIAAKHGVITPCHEHLVQAERRLQAAISGKGTRFSVIGIKASRSAFQDLAVEYVRAKEVVQLSYATVDSDVASVGAFVTGGEGRRELLLLGDKPSGRAIELHGQKWNALGPGGTGPAEYMLAGRAVAVIVNPANKVESLTLGQIQAIFQGEVDDWAIIGSTGLTAGGGTGLGPEGAARRRAGGDTIPIHRFGLYSREPATKVFEKECLVRRKWRRVKTKKDTAAAVAAVSMDPRAIAFVNLSAIPATGQNVKVLAIQIGIGEKAKIIQPTPDNIRNAMYALSQRLFLYVHPKASDTAKDFAKFIATCGGSEASPYTDTVKAVMETYQKHGLIPLADAAIERVTKDAMAAAAAKAKAEAAKPKKRRAGRR